MKHNKVPPPPTVPAIARISDPLLELLAVEVSISGFEIHTVANCKILHGWIIVNRWLLWLGEYVAMCVSAARITCKLCQKWYVFVYCGAHLHT